MKRNGFTLIELLAVIVILAIIALIAAPIILGIISDARNESEERSVELYANSIKNGAATYQLKEGVKLEPGKYNKENPLPFQVEYNGNVNCETVEIYQNGVVYIEGCTVNNGTKKYAYQIKEDKEVTKTYANGDPVYYDVSNGKGCSTYTESQSNTGVNTGCMKFYAFNDDGGEKLNLILDHNTTPNVKWHSTRDNTKGPDEVLAQLKSDTDSWVGTIQPENYTIDQSAAPSGAKFTVDYTGYKARLITANEVAQITGNTGWDETLETSKLYYMDSLTSTRADNCTYKVDMENFTIIGITDGCKYGWLYDRIAKSCVAGGCYNDADENTKGAMNSYWTISPVAYDSNLAWYIQWSSYIGGGYTDNYDATGVRPVITILKSQLK